MRVDNQSNKIPVSGTFRLLSAIAGASTFGGSKPCRTRIEAADRGSAPEAFVLSVMAGLAVLSVTGVIIMDFFGLWGLIALFPAWGVVLHVLGVACAGLAQLLSVAGVLRPAWRPGFNGICFGLIVAVVSVLQFRLADPFSWFALPWLGFVAIECLLWPFCRLLDTAEKAE